MNKLYILSFFLILIGSRLSAQETATPVLNKSNRIILHFKDTTGLFTALARILIERGHDIEFKDRELGILRTKPSTIPGGISYNDQMEVKTVFSDSTITFSSAVHTFEFNNASQDEVIFTKKRWRVNNISWDELMLITALLKPDTVTYSAINTFKPYIAEGYIKPPK